MSAGQPARPGPRGRLVRAAGLVAATALTLGLALLARPSVLGASGTVPLAQAVAFRVPIALGLLALAALTLVLPGGRRARVTVAVLLALGSAAQGGVLVGRGYDGSSTGISSADGTVAAEAASVVVLSFNTLGTATSPDLAALVLAHDADVVVLAETEERTGQATATLLAAAGHPMTVIAHRSGASTSSSTVLLVAHRLGDYALTDLAPTHQATLVSGPRTPAPDAGPVVVAAHTIAPIGRSIMADWRRETAWVRDACRETPGAIVAGDLNATLDHPGLQGLSPCVDAADAVGSAALGTWPASAPTWLAAPLDHVLVDARVWDVTGFAVLPATGGSDHRPIVAHLRRR